MVLASTAWVETHMSSPPPHRAQQYNPELDREQFEAEIKQYALTHGTEGVHQMKRMALATPTVLDLADKATHMADEQ